MIKRLILFTVVALLIAGLCAGMGKQGNFLTELLKPEMEVADLVYLDTLGGDNKYGFSNIYSPNNSAYTLLDNGFMLTYPTDKINAGTIGGYTLRAGGSEEYYKIYEDEISGLPFEGYSYMAAEATFTLDNFTSKFVPYTLFSFNRGMSDAKNIGTTEALYVYSDGAYTCVDFKSGGVVKDTWWTYNNSVTITYLYDFSEVAIGRISGKVYLNGEYFTDMIYTPLNSNVFSVEINAFRVQIHNNTSEEQGTYTCTDFAWKLFTESNCQVIRDILNP